MEALAKDFSMGKNVETAACMRINAHDLDRKRKTQKTYKISVRTKTGNIVMARALTLSGDRELL